MCVCVHVHERVYMCVLTDLYSNKLNHLGYFIFHIDIYYCSLALLTLFFFLKETVTHLEIFCSKNANY